MNRIFTLITLAAAIFLLAASSEAQNVVNPKLGNQPPDYEFGPDATWRWSSYASADQVATVLDEGYRLVDLEVVGTSPLRFTAVYVRNSGSYARAWWWYFGQTAASVAEKLSAHQARLIQLKPYRVNGALRFACVMVLNTGSHARAWSWWPQTTTSALATHRNNTGDRILEIEPYLVNGQVRYAAIADNSDQGGFTALLTHSNAAGIEAWMASHPDYTLVDWERRPDGHYAAIAAKDPDLTYHWRYRGLSAAEVSHLAGRHSSRVVDVESYVVGNERHYDIMLTDNGLPQQGSGNSFAGKQAYDSRIRDFMKQRGIPAMGLALLKDGRLIYTQGYGRARVGGGDELATPTTLFRIGSASKVSAAAAMLQLIEAGALTPNGSILSMETRIFRDVLEGSQGVGMALSQYNATQLDQVTVRHVLQHIAGFTGNPITDTINIARDLGIERTPTCQETVRWMLDKSVEFSPDTGWRYYNTGPCIISAAVEVLTGMTFEAYLHEHVFWPLGVENLIVRSADLFAERAPGEAEHYSTIPDIVTGNERVTPRYLELAPAWFSGWPVWNGMTVKFPYGGIPLVNGTAPGGLAASPLAYARFLSGLDGTSEQWLITPDTFDNMMRGPSSWANYGTFVSLNPNNGDVFHNGAVGGGFAWFVIKTADDVIWVVAANSSAGTSDVQDLNLLMINAYNAANGAGAFDAATWDLFPSYGIVLASTIFADGFESGNAAAWTSWN